MNASIEAISLSAKYLFLKNFRFRNCNWSIFFTVAFGADVVRSAFDCVVLGTKLS